MAEGGGGDRERLSVRYCAFVVERRRQRKIKRALQRENRDEKRGRMKRQKGKDHAVVCVIARERGQLPS